MVAVLTINDLKGVREYIHDVSSKWYDIGIELDIHVGTLDNIKAQHPDPSHCLREMLIVWLKSVNPEPSWNKLLTALCAKAVGEQALALDSKAAVRGKKGIAFDFSSTIGTPAKGSISQCGARGLNNVNLKEISRLPGSQASPLSSTSKCHCGKQPILLTVVKDSENKGRQFYRCPNQQRRCDFFKWADELSATPSSQKLRQQSGSMSGSTPKLGKRQSREEKCHCGIKATLRKSRRGENKGRWFYGCSRYFDENGCKFSKSAPPGPRCSFCKELGHNIRSCGKKTSVKRKIFNTN